MSHFLWVHCDLQIKPVMWSPLCVATKTFTYITKCKKGTYGKFSNPSTKHLDRTQHFLDIISLWGDIFCSLCLLLKLQSNKIRFCFVCTFLFLALCSDSNGKIHWTRCDKANRLNGGQLVVDDDITSLHYRAIDRKIPMDGESGRMVAGVSDTLSSVASRL